MAFRTEARLVVKKLDKSTKNENQEELVFNIYRRMWHGLNLGK